MTQKLPTRELERQLRKEPENLALRLRLAAAYRETGRAAEAVQLYRSVAVAYHAQRRLAQAIAVCRSVLDIEPGQRETLALLAELEAMRAGGDEGHSPVGGTPMFSGDTGLRAALTTGEMPAVPPGQASSQTGNYPLARPASIPTPPPAAAPWSAGSGTGSGPALTPPPEPSSPGMPMVRVLDRDVAVRELTPVRTVRSPSGSMPVQTPAGPRAGRNHRTDQIAVPPPPPPPPPIPSRSSAPEDTPLPRPVPYHEVGDDSMAHIAPMAASLPLPGTPRPAPRTAPPGPAVPVARASVPPPLRARAEDHDPEDAATTGVSGERPIGRRRVPLPPRPLTPPPDDEDAVTHVSGEWPVPRTPPPALPAGPAPQRSPTRPIGIPAPPTSSMDLAAEVETRRMPRLSPRELELLRRGSGSEPPPNRGDLDEEPTRPPLAGLPPPRPATTLPSDLRIETSPEAVPQLRDVSPDPGYIRRGSRTLEDSPWGEEATDQRGPDPAIVGDGLSDGTPELGDGVLPTPVFDRPFAETLEGLGPDGSAIEAASSGRLGVFSSLPADVVADLEQHMLVRHVAAGEVVLREGDRGDSCFVIGAGEVRVLKSSSDDSSARVEVARLGDGALFGEFALLADRRRHATVEAVTACELYEIPRRLLRELAAGHPEVGPALERFYRERLLATLLTTAPLFKNLPEDQRGELLSRFSPVHAESGQALVREGESAGGFYLIVLGAVDIVKRVNERRSVLLATLREGAFFGEMSLLSGHTASASVIAAGPVELARLPPRDFYDVVASHPRLWESMRNEARHRELENARIVAGDSSSV